MTCPVVDENQIQETDAVLFAAADMRLKNEESLTGQSVFFINN